MTTTSAADPVSRSWAAPQPRNLLKVRRELAKYTASTLSVEVRAQVVDHGAINVLPWIPNAPINPATMLSAAFILTTLESERLSEATVFAASRDMTNLALAAAQTPPQEPFREWRLPADSGLIVFDEPIGSYTSELASMQQFDMARPGLAITIPIVAASWSRWRPVEVVTNDQPLEWYVVNTTSGPGLVDRDFDGVWITFYTDNTTNPYDILDPEEPLARRSDGSIVTAREFQARRAASHRHEPLLAWETDIIVPWGRDLSEPAPADTAETWLQVLYTAWQLMTQKSKRGASALTTTTALTPRSADVRRDGSEGIKGDSAVRVVRVHSQQRDPTQAGPARSTTRGEREWSCRWTVRTHRKNLCMNPHRHKADECEHEDYLYPFHVRGPADKPLKLPNTVHLWDQAPDDITES